MESLAPVLVDDMELLLDVLPKGSIAVVCDPERVRTRAADLVATSQEFLGASWAAAAGGGIAPVDLGPAAYRTLGEVRLAALRGGRAWWGITPFAADEELAELAAISPGPASPAGHAGEADDGDAATRTVDATEPPAYRGETDRAVSDIGAWARQGWRVVLLTEGHGPTERLVEVLRSADVPAVLVSAVLKALR